MTKHAVETKPKKKRRKRLTIVGAHQKGKKEEKKLLSNSDPRNSGEKKKSLARLFDSRCPVLVPGAIFEQRAPSGKFGTQDTIFQGGGTPSDFRNQAIPHLIRVQRQEDALKDHKKDW